MADEIAIPYLLYDDAQAAVDWLTDALDAECVQTQLDEAGNLFHAEVRIGKARIMLGDPGPEEAYGGPAQAKRIHAMVLVYVPEVDDIFAKAVAAGATPLAEPADKPWGDRTCGFIDPQGQHWYFHRAPA